MADKSADAMGVQAKFLVQLHGPKAQERLIKEIKEAGANANSPNIQRTKELLRRVTELLAISAA